MTLSRAIRCFAVLSILLIAGAWSAAPALAHAGHSHLGTYAVAAPQAVAPQAVAPQATVPEASAPEAAVAVELDIELALIELARTGSSAPQPAPLPASSDSRQGSTAPCDGHCCVIHSSPCCSFTPPGGICAFARPLAGILASLPLADLPRDGLAPESILRPPRSFA